MLHLTVTEGISQSALPETHLISVYLCYSWHRLKLQIRIEKNRPSYRHENFCRTYFILVHFIARAFNRFTDESVKRRWRIYLKFFQFRLFVRKICESVKCVRFLILETSFELTLNNEFWYLPNGISISETFLQLKHKPESFFSVKFTSHTIKNQQYFHSGYGNLPRHHHHTQTNV